MKDSRILLVEDEALVGIEIKSSLQRLGYTRTDLVKSGEEALEAIQGQTPDLVLMDVNLAGSMDGIETTLEIHDEYGDLPVVFLTAYSSDSTIDQIRETDALGYVIKPIDESDLETVAHSVLENQQEDGINSGQFFVQWLRKYKQTISGLTPTVLTIPV
jgi:CheY-like chemotaxis protein